MCVNEWKKKIQYGCGILGIVALLLISNVFVLRSAIVEQAGLAVASTISQWNPVQDAIVGDGLQSGVLANGLYGWTGTAFNRLRVDGSNNLLMDLATSLPGGANVIGGVTQSGTWTVNSVQSGTWNVNAVGTGTAGTPATGVLSVQGISGGTSLNVGTPLGTALFVEGSYKFNHISTNATTVVKNTSGILHTVVVNNPGATWVVQICDNTTSCASGTIATITSPAAGGTYIYDIATTNGITVVSSGTTPGDVTISFN